mmetsp:Transcript_68150/g.142383  ORF Transcript_68150/g.142383 Transcript_68150/m.142383 type:complete len:427 (-) Transcript_68150:157-1437(-)
MGVMLSQPVELTRVQRKGSSAFRAAVAEMQGWRTSHEDAHEMMCTSDWGSFWVLDGHGGDGASIYCAPELAKTTSNKLKEANTLPDDGSIATCFEETDKKFRSHCDQNPEQDSGSTVVGALITKGKDGTYSLKLTNCGDSRGLVIAPPTQKEAPSSARHKATRPGHLTEDLPSWPLISVTIDHKPDHPTEKARIEAAGGYVSVDDPPRLDGNLAVSRGMGDFEYKQSSEKRAGDQKVSCVPDIYEVSGLESGTIVVLACDGLWDVLTDQQVADLVRADLAANAQADLGVMCAELVHKALAENSRDNITCMIIHLTDGTNWSENTNRFNGSDEMMYFSKIAARGEGNIDEDLKKHYATFLRRCKFPDKPVQCAVTGRWFDKMFKCPGTQNVYMSRHCQKQGWSRHKKGEPIEKEYKTRDLKDEPDTY